jgi:hypothetical protein
MESTIMTKLTLKENLVKKTPVTSDYDFNNIESGDMFHCYESDKTIFVAINEETFQYVLVDLSDGTVVPEEPLEYFEDVFKRLTELYGKWYFISNAQIKFTVGE